MAKVQGPCYPAAEALYHLLGGKKFGLTPMQIVHEGVSHWYLRWSTPGGPPFYLDPTVDQFKTVPDYGAGRGRGFLTKQPSKRAMALIAAVRASG